MNSILIHELYAHSRTTTNKKVMTGNLVSYSAHIVNVTSDSSRVYHIASSFPHYQYKLFINHEHGILNPPALCGWQLYFKCEVT